MRIERLRISGFKSFVDTTELRVEPGLTGIVGPNGCGKSNVLESLRWVMGATSAKALRGSGMDDVIFSGTSARPARNMAEVHLTLDNSSRKAPAAFNDSDVLEVTRRIEREAGSAYRINGRDVRARDVQLLFADAGTGANSPALVRQGQVSELINAKPENRRKILEEAAGITGLHSRRHEAELRLRAAETNLQRLEDVQQQLEDQLHSLKRQARQATRYKNLAGRIRSAEALVLHLKWSQARDSLKEAEETLVRIKSEVETYTQAAAQASTAQSEAAETVPPLRQAEAAAAAAVQRLNIEKDTIDKDAQLAKDQAAALTTTLEQISADVRREQAMRRDASAALEALDQEKTTLEQERSDETSRVESAKKAVDACSKGLADAERKLDELSGLAAQRHAKMEALRAAISQANAQKEKLSGELTDARRELQALALSDDKDTEKQDLEKRIDSAEREYQLVLERLANADRERSRSWTQADDLRAPLQEAEKHLNKLKAEAKALSGVLNVDAGGLWPPVIDAVRVEPGYEVALAAALGEDLNAPTDEAAPVHWEHVADVLDQALPMGAEPLSRFVTGPVQLARRLSQIGVVDRHQGAAMRRALRAGQRLVSKEGDLWRWDGFSASAEADTPAARRLAQRNRLRELDSEIEAAKETHQQAEQVFKGAEQRASDASQAAESIRRLRHQTEAARTEAQEALVAFNRQNAERQSKLAALQEAETRMLRSLSELNDQMSSQQQELAELEVGEDHAGEIVEQRTIVAEARAALSESNADLQALNREAAVRTERLNAIASERQQWQTRTTNAEAQIERLNERKSKAAWELKAAEEVPLQLEGKRVKLIEAVKEAEQKRQAAADGLAEAEAKLRACDRAVKETQETLAEARENLVRTETQLQSNLQRRDELVHQIQDALNVPPEDLLQHSEHGDKPLPPLKEIENKLERLKRERENMGAVNLRAEQESAELVDKLEEIGGERSDLEEAIAKLRKGINTLNSEGRERILSAFNDVNEQFTRLFEVLFAGGSAKLELTESDDPLSAGLDIFARPPGKKLQNLSLMSGGEQALTAMALILAVFVSNPAPVCFLDEVDAPLDDSNVERFCNLLHEMKKITDTRFFVITHNALSMANMDRLYGVTMAERGVSQLVSVDLSEAEQMREAS